MGWPAMVMRSLGLTAGLAAASLLLANIARADGVADCERHALAFFKRHGSGVSKIQIETGTGLDINRYDDKVGSQFVSTEYVGFARVTAAGGVKRQRFVCLHAGDGKRAVYFTLIAE
jgi:hypothetical protein